MRNNNSISIQLIILMLIVSVLITINTISIKSLSEDEYTYYIGEVLTFTDDYYDVWYNSLREFGYIISNNEYDWGVLYSYDYPYVGPYMWTEEAYGGSDNFYADHVELSIVLGHSCIVGDMSAIGFGDKGCATPDNIRLGYQSPDSFGYSIWTFIIQCSVLEDQYVGDWLQPMTGVHMILGFASIATVSTSDFSELAYRMTGTGGYSQENIQDAFFHTFVAADGVHNDNVGRIIAENSYVADYDRIDYFYQYTPVDNVKLIITSWIP